MSTTLDPAIRERHYPETDEAVDEGRQYCAFDQQFWGEAGCDTAQVLAALSRYDEAADIALSAREAKPDDLNLWSSLEPLRHARRESAALADTGSAGDE